MMDIQKNKPLSDQQIIGLEQTHLTVIENNSELLGQKFQCHHEALVPLAKLIRQSEIDGIPLRVVSSYRSFEHQLAIWNRKFNENIQLNLPDGGSIDSQSLSETERVAAILHYSALPGTSRHHWGTDFDVFDAAEIDCGYKVQLIEEEFSAQGPCGNLNLWLDENLTSFGFFKPYSEFIGGYQCEPWHISLQAFSEAPIKNFPIQLLADTLEKSEIGGKKIILSQLDEIVETYVKKVNSHDMGSDLC